MTKEALILNYGYDFFKLIKNNWETNITKLLILLSETYMWCHIAYNAITICTSHSSYWPDGPNSHYHYQ